jgi:hypothetical protein
MVGRLLVAHRRAVLALGIAFGVVGIVAVAVGEGLVGWIAATIAMVLLVGLQLARGERLGLPDGWP